MMVFDGDSVLPKMTPLFFSIQRPTMII